MHCIYIATPKWRYSVAVVSVQTTTSMLARPTVHVQQLLIKRGIHLFIISPSSHTGAAMAWNEMLPVDSVPKNPCNVGEQDQDFSQISRDIFNWDKRTAAAL